MLLKVYSIYDSVSQFYNTPFHANNRGEAVRSVTDLVNDPNTSLNKHPDDYVLFELGTFDNSSATYDLLPSPLSCGVLVEYLRTAHLGSAA